MEPRPPSSPAPRSSPDTTSPTTGSAPNTLRAPVPELTRPLSPLEQNRRITEGYARIAQGIQAFLDPAYRPGGISRIFPNWFAVAPHASQEAGKGMVGTAIARRIIDAAQGQASPSVAQAFIRAGLSLPQRMALAALSQALSWYGLPHDVAAALASLQGAMNLEALADPRTLWATAQRFAKLYLEAPGFLPLSKAEAVVLTLERCLNEGNVAIFSDIGAAAESYLAWRQQAGAVTPERIVKEFSLPGAQADQVRRAYDYALAHAQQVPRLSDFARALPGVNSASILVTGFALYDMARVSPGPVMRDALIGLANNCVAYREQYEAVQPAFTPPTRRADEVSRPELMKAMTPLLALQYSTVTWKFTDYSGTQRDRDGNPLTSRATEYNWALFQDRWPAILQAFEVGYQNGPLLWNFPRPLVGPDGQLTGQG